MAVVFGPVPSRRLGRSLGVDLVPHKTCNWNCVYCQLGRTTPLTNTRCAYRPTRTVGKDLLQALRHCRGQLDFITFVGAGEPTLHLEIGRLIRQVKDSTEIPVAVITNGSLLYLPQVARDLAAADLVLPSLDAGHAALYRAINRPHPSLSYSSLRRGLAQFRQAYPGRLWLEVMLVAGMNDDEPSLLKLAAALPQISPDEVHIATPFRAPAEAWVKEPPAEAVALACSILGERARVLPPDAAGVTRGGGDILKALSAVIARHPLPDEAVRQALANSLHQVEEGIRRLSHHYGLQQVCRNGRWFWCPARGRYGQPRRRRGKQPPKAA